MSGDASWSSVGLLAQNDNAASGSTTFADQSLSAHTLTANGNAQYSSLTAPAGMTTSALFDGVGDYLTTPSSTDWDFGAGDMTVEMEIKTASGLAYANLICREWVASPWSGGWNFFLNGGTNGPLEIWWADYSSSVAFLTGSGSTQRDGSWHHIAWSRAGQVHRMFLDGAQQATRTVATNFASVSKAITIGRDLTFGGTGQRDYSGSMCNLRITKGVARYTGAFTPPSLPLPNSALIAVVNRRTVGPRVGSRSS